MIRYTRWLIFFLLIAVSCLDEPDCFSLNNNIIGISFRKMLTGQADTVALKSVKAEGFDSLFLVERIVNKISLPLNYFQQNTAFIFEGLETTRRLDLNYSAKAQFVSEECGERFVLSDLNIGSHDFDSIRLVDPNPGKGTSNNIEIYRCPRFDMLKVAFMKRKDGIPVRDTADVSISTNYPATIVMTADSVQFVNIPLDQASTTSVITFTFKNESPKTLTLSYSKKDSVFFDICGPQTLLGKLQKGATALEVNILKDTIQDPPILNLEIIR